MGGLWQQVRPGSHAYEQLVVNNDSGIFFGTSAENLMTRRMSSALSQLKERVQANASLSGHSLLVIAAYISPDSSQAATLPNESLYFSGRKVRLGLTGSPSASDVRILVDLLVADGSFGYVSYSSATFVEASVLRNQCDIAADVVFLVDGSNSMTQSTFNESLQFASSVSSFFDVGPDAMRVGMVTFSGFDQLNVNPSGPDCTVQFCIWKAIV